MRTLKVKQYYQTLDTIYCQLVMINKKMYKAEKDYKKLLKTKRLKT